MARHVTRQTPTNLGGAGDVSRWVEHVTDQVLGDRVVVARVAAGDVEPGGTQAGGHLRARRSARGLAPQDQLPMRSRPRRGGFGSALGVSRSFGDVSKDMELLSGVISGGRRPAPRRSGAWLF